MPDLLRVSNRHLISVIYEVTAANSVWAGVKSRAPESYGWDVSEYHRWRYLTQNKGDWNSVYILSMEKRVIKVSNGIRNVTRWVAEKCIIFAGKNIEYLTHESLKWMQYKTFINLTRIVRPFNEL